MNKLKVAAVIFYDSDKKFLLQHRTADAKYLPDHWAFFGGQVEEGETPVEAACREAFEELGFQPKLPELVVEQNFRQSGAGGRLYVFIEPFYGDKLVLKLCEGQEWGWFTKAETRTLKMVGRDRKIIKAVDLRLKSTGGPAWPGRKKAGA